MTHWKTLHRTTLLDRPWLRVDEERVELPGGRTIDQFHLIHAPSWAAICCVTAARELVLVEQYRHGHGGLTWELPAGVIEPAEPALDGARREMLEETGYASEDWVELGCYRPEPARHTHFAHLFVARGAQRVGEQRLDESEQMKVVLFPLGELPALLEHPRFVHSVHVAALLLAQARGLLPA